MAIAITLAMPMPIRAMRITLPLLQYLQHSADVALEEELDIVAQAEMEVLLQRASSGLWWCEA